MCRITKKTIYENIGKIMECLHDAALLFQVEERMQLEQIKKEAVTNDEAISWINKNAKDYRDYLEKIENLARKYKNKPSKARELICEIDNLGQEFEK